MSEINALDPTQPDGPFRVMVRYKRNNEFEIFDEYKDRYTADDAAKDQGNRPITSRIQWFYVQDFKQIVSIPTGLQPLGLNAAFQCFFLL